MIKYKLRERIAFKSFQEKRHVTLIEIANATGCGRITLSRMLNRGTPVRTDTLDRLCAYFGCRLDELVEYQPDEISGLARKRRAPAA